MTATYPPVASVTWEFNGGRIKTQSMERFYGGSVSSPSLLITNLQHTDEGNYTCIVSNLYSSDTAVVSLDIVNFGKKYWNFLVYQKFLDKILTFKGTFIYCKIDFYLFDN